MIPMHTMKVFAALVLIATPAVAQQAPAVDRPVAAPGVATGTGAGTGPNGATLRCRNGSYPAAGAPDSACDGKGGVLVRFPLRRVQQSRPAEARAEHPATRDSAVRDTAAPQPQVQSYEARRAAIAARAQSATRPAGATLLCNDGTYVVGDSASVRCASKGGVKVRFVTRRTP
jgi:hypothetical protein